MAIDIVVGAIHSDVWDDRCGRRMTVASDENFHVTLFYWLHSNHEEIFFVIIALDVDRNVALDDNGVIVPAERGEKLLVQNMNALRRSCCYLFREDG